MHTEGKWHMIKGGFSKGAGNHNMIQIYATNDDLELICKVWKDGILHNREQDFEANAKLIAASPELLVALERFTVLDTNHYKDIAGLIQSAREVVDLVRK